MKVWTQCQNFVDSHTTGDGEEVMKLAVIAAALMRSGLKFRGLSCPVLLLPRQNLQATLLVGCLHCCYFHHLLPSAPQRRTVALGRPLGWRDDQEMAARTSLHSMYMTNKDRRKPR